MQSDYRILKGVTYKSGTCATMLIAKADITSNGKENDGDDMPTPPAAESKVPCATLVHVNLTSQFWASNTSSRGVVILASSLRV